jgi:5'-nucleotidase
MLISPKLRLAISSRALFDLDISHQVFEAQGIEQYYQYQITNESKPLNPGVAFSLAKKLLDLKDPQTGEALAEVILLSRNSADTGLRIFNSIQHYQLAITRAVFTNGVSVYPYIPAFGAQLFLSANPEDVSNTLAAGHAAAIIFPASAAAAAKSHQLRIAFDGDAVLFSDESEKIYQQQGLQAFMKNEKNNANIPLTGGPFKPFLSALHHIQQKFPMAHCPIRTALVTAREAPAHERVVHTLRAWNIRIDEALFLGGLKKGEFLAAFAADFYFDDQTVNCQDSLQFVATGQVISDDKP